MNESFSEELLSAYLDGEVTPEESVCVEQWLAEQPEHQCILHELRQLRQELQALPRETLSPEFAQRVLTAIRRRNGDASTAPLECAPTTSCNPSNSPPNDCALPTITATPIPRWQWFSAGIAATLLVVVLSLLGPQQPGPTVVHLPINPEMPKLGVSEPRRSSIKNSVERLEVESSGRPAETKTTDGFEQEESLRKMLGSATTAPKSASSKSSTEETDAASMIGGGGGIALPTDPSQESGDRDLNQLFNTLASVETSQEMVLVYADVDNLFLELLQQPLFNRGSYQEFRELTEEVAATDKQLAAEKFQGTPLAKGKSLAGRMKVEDQLDRKLAEPAAASKLAGALAEEQSAAATQTVVLEITRDELPELQAWLVAVRQKNAALLSWELRSIPDDESVASETLAGAEISQLTIDKQAFNGASAKLGKAGSLPAKLAKKMQSTGDGDLPRVAPEAELSEKMTRAGFNKTTAGSPPAKDTTEANSPQEPNAPSAQSSDKTGKKRENHAESKPAATPSSVPTPARTIVIRILPSKKPASLPAAKTQE